MFRSSGHSSTYKLHQTKERAIGGVTEGLIELGESVTWQAVHLGINQKLTAKITEMEKPYRFTDEMVKGAFQSFKHTHEFIESGTGTVMKDKFTYISPLCILGKLADQLFLEKYMKAFIVNRASALKEIAENSNTAYEIIPIKWSLSETTTSRCKTISE
jgi:ligand-binding SRPBCC domain-containing protein